jgi:hypothetical protein
MRRRMRLPSPADIDLSARVGGDPEQALALIGAEPKPLGPLRDGGGPRAQLVISLAESGGRSQSRVLRRGVHFSQHRQGGQSKPRLRLGQRWHGAAALNDMHPAFRNAADIG